MTLTTNGLTNWLHPWPIKLPNRKWTLQVVPFSQAEKLYCFWYVNGTEKRTIAWWADQCAKYKAPSEQHYIHMLARDRIPVLPSLTVIVTEHRGVQTVIDGNHHLIALALVRRHKFHGRATKLTHVGVLRG